MLSEIWVTGAETVAEYLAHIFIQAVIWVTGAEAVAEYLAHIFIQAVAEFS